MPTTPRDRLVRLLAGSEVARADTAETSLTPDALSVHVDGVGEVTTPVRAAMAKKLIAVARPAAYGHGAETLQDATVRDTWELTPEQVTLGGDTWPQHLTDVLDEFRDTLGLPPDSRLRAEFHSMLVYGKGQFFLPHQDSEKNDEMVATLVVSLPSVHTGGELVIDDGGRQRTFRASRDEMTLVAFYADRRHEVRPVRSGHRVTLTFNLLLSKPAASKPAGAVEQAAGLLTQHFTTSTRSLYGDRDLGTPDRLAVLLDHEYTQRGLAAGRFRGVDGERVQLLREAAAQAGCECVFALADVHETRDAVVEYRGRNDWYDEEFEDYADDDDYTDGDLIDGETGLVWWITPGESKGHAIQLPLYDAQVCAVTPSSALTPYESEYEGYMGNYGNTIDRWYHRSAIVLWPTEKAFANRAAADPRWAVRAIQEKITAGDLAAARSDALSLEEFWSGSNLADLATSLHLASGLRDPQSSMIVLAPYRLQMLTPELAGPLATVADTYGNTWCDTLLDHWDTANPYDFDHLAWIGSSLLPVCRALTAAGAATVADPLVDRVWRWLWRRIRLAIQQPHPVRRADALAELGPALARTVESAGDGPAQTIVEELSATDDRANPLLLSTVRAHEPPASAPLKMLAQECWERTVRGLARPKRLDDDWSIAWSGCGCVDCEQLTAFLGSRTERTMAWPLAQARRQHIHAHIDNGGLPVTHVTRRQGRPYTLMLTKTDELFTREADERLAEEADVQWLVGIIAALDERAAASFSSCRIQTQRTTPSGTLPVAPRAESSSEGSSSGANASHPAAESLELQLR